MPASLQGNPPAPLRIFHLIKSLGRGGAEVLLSEGLKYADRERFTYGYGYFLPWKDAVVPELERQGADVACFAARSNAAILLSAWKVAHFLRAWQADLLHCHLPVAGVAGRLAGKLASVPVVYTEHNEMDRYHPLTRWANVATWRWQERVIAVSEAAAAAARRRVGEQVPIEVVLNGVDTEHFAPSSTSGAPVRARLGIPEKAPLVGTIAVFRVQKQLHHWLQAARCIHEGHPEARFVIVGEGPRREELEALKAALGLEGIVHFAGFQEDVRPFLAAMDLYMMSSKWEGLPIALLEAMAMGCPIVATAVGGIPSVVEEGTSGLLVEAGDVRGLVEAAGHLVADPERRAAMGKAARERVKNSFSMRRMARALESVYVDVLEHEPERHAR